MKENMFGDALSENKNKIIPLIFIITLSLFSISVFASLKSVSNTGASSGSVWIEGSELHWSNGSFEYWLEDPEVYSDNSDRSKGGWWIKEGYMYWVGENNHELRYKGPVISSDPDTYKGDVWIENGFLHYVDSHGKERITCWDDDNDGFFSISCGGEDCDDSDQEINPETTWYKDRDGDGYYSDKMTQCSSPNSYWKIDSNLKEGDCCDNDVRVKPDDSTTSIGYYSEKNNCSNWDYNCDDYVQKKYGLSSNEEGELGCAPGQGSTYCDEGYLFINYPPDCGKTGNTKYVTGYCTRDNECARVEKIQECR